jgi:hypothetical protein
MIMYLLRTAAFLVLILSFALVEEAKGQRGSIFDNMGFNGGASIVHQRFSGEFTGPYTGIGGYGVLRFSDEYGLRVQVIYGGYSERSYDVTQNGVEVTETISGSGLDIHLGYQHFFSGDFDDGGFYAQASGIFKLANLTYTYDSELIEDSESSTSDALIEVGAGYSMEAGPGNLYFEVAGAIPARSYNSRSGVSSEIIFNPYWSPSVGYYF